MEALGQVIFHGSVQSAVGLLAGLVADYVFPAPGPAGIVSTSDLVIQLIEIAGQVMMSSLAATLLFTQLTKVAPLIGDPQYGLAFVLLLTYSQINLREKIENVVEYAKAELRGGK